MADVREHAPQLVREVELPSREHSGIAAILVAASALTFALAGSAFALWARTTTNRCQHNHHQTPTYQSQAWQGGENASDANSITKPDCLSSLDPARHLDGTASPDGTVFYRLCPDRATPSTVTPANTVLIEEHEGMVVFRIVD